MKTPVFSCLSVCLFFIFSSCNSHNPSSPGQNPDTARVINKDSMRQVQAEAKVMEEKKAEMIEHSSVSQYNAFARFIAGLPQKTENNYSKLQKDSLWINHASRINSRWSAMEKRNVKMISFSENELPASLRETETLFYPFSGPDILNANIFFPKAKAYYMFGLEPVGNLPDVLLNTSKQDSLYKYFHSLDRALWSISNFSFFRTKSMEKDLKEEELNGTIHLMILFLARNHNDIANIRYVFIDENGNVKDNANRSVKQNEGVEILFADDKGGSHTVTYFSVNLDNSHLTANKGLTTFIKNLGSFDTYLKAASYLMHFATFSEVRNMILAQTRHVLEDDSGIPFRYFTDSKKWEVALYGVYVKPIALFANHYQKDLDSAYKDTSLYRKPLEFGTGYQFKQSNLLLATKK
jgi:hypothetical protein